MLTSKGKAADDNVSLIESAIVEFADGPVIYASRGEVTCHTIVVPLYESKTTLRLEEAIQLFSTVEGGYVFPSVIPDVPDCLALTYMTITGGKNNDKWPCEGVQKITSLLLSVASALVETK